MIIMSNKLAVNSEKWIVNSEEYTKKEKIKRMLYLFFFCGDPYGNRTHDSALRGPRLNRLTNGP